MPGDVEPVSRFLRLSAEGICTRAGTTIGRGAFTALGRFISSRHHCPRSGDNHGYPDWFRFHVTKWNGFREIGNSVPARPQDASSALPSYERVTPTRGGLSTWATPSINERQRSERPTGQRNVSSAT